MGLSKNIAYRLRTLREAAGLSQVQVAEKADLSLSLITKMERGRKADPRASTLLALAAALGVRPGQLIDDLTPPPEGVFPDKKKKKEKKKAQKLAATLTSDTTSSHAAPSSVPAAESSDSPPLVVVPNLLGTDTDQKKAKKKKKAKK